MPRTDPIDPKAFGRRIRERRKQSDLTLPQLQEMVKDLTDGARGSGYGTLQRYETGKEDEPRLNIVHAIATALGTSAEWLLREEGHPDLAHEMAESAPPTTEPDFIRSANDALANAFGGDRLFPIGRAVFIHAWQKLGWARGVLSLEEFALALAAPLGEIEADGIRLRAGEVEDYIIQVAPALARALSEPLKGVPSPRATATEGNDQEDTDE